MSATINFTPSSSKHFRGDINLEALELIWPARHVVVHVDRKRGLAVFQPRMDETTPGAVKSGSGSIYCRGLLSEFPQIAGHKFELGYYPKCDAAVCEGAAICFKIPSE